MFIVNELGCQRQIKPAYFDFFKIRSLVAFFILKSRGCILLLKCIPRKVGCRADFSTRTLISCQRPVLPMTHRYYYIDSSGPDTNLQLYSLQQAKLYWSGLEKDLAENDQIEHFHERCVFIICTMGLSVSQLLGQNDPAPSERVPSPSMIFNNLIDKHNLKGSLKQQFREFIDTYDHCRHFGLTSDGSRHWEVSQVTLEKTRKMYKFGLLVWETVIDIFRKEPGSELDDLDLEEIEHDL